VKLRMMRRVAQCLRIGAIHWKATIRRPFLFRLPSVFLMSRALIGLGSNLGERRPLLDEAVANIATLPQTAVAAQSEWYETAPIGGPPHQSPFLNGALLVDTQLSVSALLDALQNIESTLGRTRETAWGPRTIDLDVLLYDDAVVESTQLRVPHPRLAYRKFVLRGAAQIAGSWRHPQLGRTLAELAAHLDAAPRYAATTGLSQGFRSQLAAEAADAGRARLVEPTDADVPASVEQLVSHGLTAGIAIKFLHARLDAIRRSLAESADAWVIDDAWLAAEAAELARHLGDTERAEFVAAWREASSPSVEPRLLIGLRTANEPPSAAVREIVAAAPFEILLPPVIDVVIADREAALLEIAAAMEAAA